MLTLSLYRLISHVELKLFLLRKLFTRFPLTVNNNLSQIHRVDNYIKNADAVVSVAKQCLLKSRLFYCRIHHFKTSELCAVFIQLEWSSRQSMWRIPGGIITHYEGTWLSDLSIDNRTDAKLHPRLHWLGSRYFECLVRADKLQRHHLFFFTMQVKRVAFKESGDVLNNVALIWIF